MEIKKCQKSNYNFQQENNFINETLKMVPRTWFNHFSSMLTENKMVFFDKEYRL